MTRALLSLLLLSSAQTANAAPVDRGRRAARAAIDCAAATKIALPGARVTAVRAVQANDSLRALGRRPHCRIEATVDVQTKIVALLPDDWNGRFLMGGGGGYVGAVDNQFGSTVHEGYANVGTDAGHSANSLTAGWALRNDARIEEFAYRAVHRTAETTKLLIAAYYGRPPERGYFIGRSRRDAGCAQTAGGQGDGALRCERRRARWHPREPRDVFVHARVVAGVR